MSENHSEGPPLDAQDWEIALRPYAAHPDAAISLARLLVIIRALLQHQPPDVPEAMAALDQAAEALFPLTEFHKGSYELFRTYIEGRATRADEVLMQSLGVKF